MLARITTHFLFPTWYCPELTSGLSVLCSGSRDDKVRAAFDLYDYNGDGFITMDEITRYLTAVFRVLYKTSKSTRDSLQVSPEELGAVTVRLQYLTLSDTPLSNTSIPHYRLLSVSLLLSGRAMLCRSGFKQRWAHLVRRVS